MRCYQCGTLRAARWRRSRTTGERRPRTAGPATSCRSKRRGCIATRSPPSRRRPAPPWSNHALLTPNGLQQASGTARSSRSAPTTLRQESSARLPFQRRPPDHLPGRCVSVGGSICMAELGLRSPPSRSLRPRRACSRWSSANRERHPSRASQGRRRTVRPQPSLAETSQPCCHTATLGAQQMSERPATPGRGTVCHTGVLTAGRGTGADRSRRVVPP